MRFTKFVTITFFVSDCAFAFNTPKEIFYDIVAIFQNASTIDHYQFMNHLQTVNNSIDCNFACKDTISQISQTNDKIVLYVSSQSKVNKFRSNVLSKFVQTYIKHQLESDNEINRSLTNILKALEAQLSTLNLAATKKVSELLMFMKSQLTDLGIIDKENISALDAAADEKYLVEGMLVFVKGIFFFLICSVLTSVLCMGLVGSLLAIQLILWIVVLIRYLLIDT
ncbi:hypothetical protein C6P45_003695 [Maudiozyma exigua]|uniref:Uncharacterized protein n=1 Tax=Maudiozyma exigua TaxID=34358 RepID=A0A9P6WER2_MAUEX|nr:hypothetical protein C6P45_003695 [Kazachstania exigua]